MGGFIGGKLNFRNFCLVALNALISFKIGQLVSGFHIRLLFLRCQVTDTDILVFQAFGVKSRRVGNRKFAGRRNFYGCIRIINSTRSAENSGTKLVGNRNISGRELGCEFQSALSTGAFGPAFKPDVEDRHEQKSQRRHTDHAAHNTGTQRMTGGRAGAGRNSERESTADERQRRHDNRTETKFAGIDSGSHQVHTFVTKFNRKFHNQNRVLCRQTDHHQHTDLEVNVVFQAAGPGCQQSSDHAERNRQNHGTRKCPAFILCSQH